MGFLVQATHRAITTYPAGESETGHKRWALGLARALANFSSVSVVVRGAVPVRTWRPACHCVQRRIIKYLLINLVNIKKYHIEYFNTCME